MSDDLVFDEVAPTETAPVEAVPEPAPVEAEPEAPEPEAAETETEDEAEKPRHKPGSQKWKEKALREAQEKDFWKAQALQNKAPEPAPVAPVSADGPKQDDFETHAEWVKASIRFEAKAMIEAEKRQQTWEQKAAATRQKFDDFDDALQTAPAPSRAVAEVLNESPLGGDVAYHLATHPDEYARINRLSPVAAALELGRIEARLNPAQKKAPAPATKAPRPPSPVTAASATRPSDDGRVESY